MEIDWFSSLCWASGQAAVRGDDGRPSPPDPLSQDWERGKLSMARKTLGNSGKRSYELRLRSDDGFS
ncbi:MAG: hypothetical protein KatS3mg048_1172 [Caldilinea sp.]|nr:MAG: hypothetical protein KatS3mg048_1172 [Caldilinea sp.]